MAYQITIIGATGGTVIPSKSSANSGETITLTVNPENGYRLTGYQTIPTTLQISSNRFTMPDGPVTITPVFQPPERTITIEQATGGTVTPNKPRAVPGETVSLSIVPNTGYSYDINTWGKTPSSLNIFAGTFTMPNADVIIRPKWIHVEYHVNLSAGTGGTLTADKPLAYFNDTVTLTPTPNTGYRFTGYTTLPAILQISNNKFTMPNYDVNITASFEKITYSITKAASPAAGGTVTTSANSAVMGTEITVTQTPNTGYYFSGWTKTPSTLSISNNKFTMPASNVSLTANYKKRSTATLNKTTLEGGGTAVLTIATESTAYTHKYELSFGTGMTTGEVNVAAGTTSVTINIPLNWSAQMPSAVSKGGGTLTLKTYSGSTQIGSYQITGLTYTVPASVKPEMGAITTSIIRTIGGVTYANVGDIYVQGKSGVRIQESISGQQGASITQITLSMSGYSGSSYSKTVTNAASIDFTSGLLTKSGTVTITITAKDSRNRTNTKTASITVQAYTKPNGSLSAWRVNNGGTADDMGTYGKYSLTRNYTAVGNNSLTSTLSVSGTTVNNPATSGDLLPGNRKTFTETTEYTVTMTLTDAFETVTITAKLPSARFIIFVDSSGNKLGFFKAANKTIPTGKSRTFEISGDAQIYYGDDKVEDYIQKKGVMSKGGTIDGNNGTAVFSVPNLFRGMIFIVGSLANTNLCGIIAVHCSSNHVGAVKLVGCESIGITTANNSLTLTNSDSTAVYYSIANLNNEMTRNT